MPQEWKDCVASVSKTKGKKSAYAICTAKYIQKHHKSPFKDKKEIASLPIDEESKKLLEAQHDAVDSGKTIKVLEEITGDVVKVAETKA